jgi:chromosome segregation ATPase
MATQETALIRVIDGHIVAADEFRLALDDLRSKVAAASPVTDQQTYAEAQEIVRQKNQEIKMVLALAEPELSALRRRLEDLRNERDKFAAEFETITSQLETQARQWNLTERQAALAEQKDMNYGKTTEKRITVAPNIPSVPGVRVVAKYRAEILDASKVKRAWLVPDLKAIEKKAREDKDPAKTEKEVGGIRVRME